MHPAAHPPSGRGARHNRLSGGRKYRRIGRQTLYGAGRKATPPGSVTLIGSAQKRWMTLRQRDWLKHFRGKAMPKLQSALGLALLLVRHRDLP
jgi:hypothetical protein